MIILEASSSDDDLIARVIEAIHDGDDLNTMVDLQSKLKDRGFKKSAFELEVIITSKHRGRERD